MRVPAAIALVLTLSACNAVYQRPATAPGGTANVRFIAPQHKGMYSFVSLYAHDGEGCGFAPRKIVGLGGMFNFGGGRKSARDIGMSKDPGTAYEAGQYFETAVAAGTPFNFTASGGEHHDVCFVSGSFIPAPGSEYEITYQTDASFCRVNVDRIGVQNSGFVREHEPSMVQRPESCSFFWN